MCKFICESFPLRCVCCIQCYEDYPFYKHFCINYKECLEIMSKRPQWNEFVMNSTDPIEALLNGGYETSIVDYFGLNQGNELEMSPKDRCEAERKEDTARQEVQETLKRKGFCRTYFIHSIRPEITEVIESLIYQYGFRPENIPSKRVAKLLRQTIGYGVTPFLMDKESYLWLEKHRFQIDKTQIFRIGRDELHKLEHIKDDA